MSNLKIKKIKIIRLLLTGIILSLILAALVGRLAYITIVKGAEYKQMAVNQWTKTIKVASKRGAIKDRDGLNLATSIQDYRIDADLTVLKKYLADKKITEKEAASKLSDVLNINEGNIEKSLSSKDSKGAPLQFVSLKRHVDSSSADAVKSLKYNGLMISYDETRIYPNNSFLAHVIGHVDWQENGINGVELSYNKELAGTPGTEILETDRADNELPTAEPILVKPVDGKDLTLTIDTQMQMLAEQVANETLKENSAKSVSITIMDPSNGEILAMVNTPAYDPNNPNGTGKTNGQIQETWKNGAVSNVFEPGSIFKVIVAAAGLQTNSVTDSDRFNSTGSIKVANRILYNDNQEANGILDLAGILRYSDNVGFVQLGQKIGKEKLYDFVTNANFGQKTGVDLPGESTGLMRKLKDIGPVELATMSYGQGVAVTQVQYLAAFNSVANGGTWIRPHVMKEISHTVDNKKVVDKQFDNLGKRNIMSKEKAAQLRTYLEGIVNNGTATATYMKGYHIAGKTGTANEVNPDTGKYQDGKYVASFAGMAPTDNPKITLIVTVCDPSPDKYYAAETAVPAAQKLFSGLFNILKIVPDGK